MDITNIISNTIIVSDINNIIKSVVKYIFWIKQLKSFFFKFLHLIKFSRQNSLLNEEKELFKKVNNQNQLKIIIKKIKRFRWKKGNLF